MNVTRDVIVDLLPLYLADEASQDTRALVKAYLEQDPELARLVAEKPNELPFATTPGAPLSREHELKTVERTKTMLRAQRILLAAAMFFSLLPLAGYQVGRHRWAMLSDFPAGAIACAVLAVATWVIYFVLRRKLNTAGG
jgi:hypothetical protein